MLLALEISYNMDELDLHFKNTYRIYTYCTVNASPKVEIHKLYVLYIIFLK